MLFYGIIFALANVAFANDLELLVSAISDKRSTSAQFIIENSNTWDVNGKAAASEITPLQAALEAENETIACMLLDKGANPNIPDGKVGNTSLMVACRSNSLKMVERLVDVAKAELEMENVYGLTALIIALRNGRDDVAKFLLRRGASTTVRAPELQERTLLRHAIYGGCTRMVEKFIREGKWLKEELNDTFPSNGHTPITLSIIKGRREMLSVLLNAGADVDKSAVRVNIVDGANTYGMCSPLHYATKAHDVSAVVALLTKGADTESLDEQGLTVMQRLSMEPTYPTYFLLLLAESGAVIDVPPDTNLKTHFYPCFKLAYEDRKEFADFDDYIVQMTRTFLQQADIPLVVRENPTDDILKAMKDTFLTYEECGIYALYRFSRRAYRGMIDKSVIEEVRDEIAAGQSQRENNRDYWSLRRRSWNLALAAHVSKIDLKDTVYSSQIDVLMKTSSV